MMKFRGTWSHHGLSRPLWHVFEMEPLSPWSHPAHSTCVLFCTLWCPTLGISGEFCFFPDSHLSCQLFHFSPLQVLQLTSLHMTSWSIITTLPSYRGPRHRSIYITRLLPTHTRHLFFHNVKQNHNMNSTVK